MVQEAGVRKLESPIYKNIDQKKKAQCGPKAAAAAESGNAGDQRTAGPYGQRRKVKVTFLQNRLPGPLSSFRKKMGPQRDPCAR